ncbi:MAG: GntG family PLP-dependent aldolase [Thermoleophilia bacterium]
MVDLRSDTLTQPTPGMRRAIAEAVVGDEQKREDPTVRALEERAAALLGKPGAVFLPTATMANQIALRLLTRPGDEAIGEAQCHVFRYEGGGPAAHSGLSMRPIAGTRGIFGPDDVRAVLNSADPHFARTRLVCIENTHNGGGGKIWPLDVFRAVVAEARAHGLAVHLDGARLLNAAVAAGVPAAAWGSEVDTVTLCLSKGLGCPLGAVLAGSEEAIAEAWRLKHLFGGAMRQAGIVAAAGVYALEHHVERLADDHANALRLAEGLAEGGLPIDVAGVETNFVQVDCTALGLTREEAAARLQAEGVLLSNSAAPGVLRALTHHDVDADAVERAIAGALRALAPAATAA